jgi:hypothetical protein
VETTVVQGEELEISIETRRLALSWSSQAHHPIENCDSISTDEAQKIGFSNYLRNQLKMLSGEKKRKSS